MNQFKKEARATYILKSIEELSLGGDSYHTLQDIKQKSRERNPVSNTKFESDFNYLVQQALLHQVWDQIYLMETWQYETFVAKRIFEMTQENENRPAFRLSRSIIVNGNLLTDEQRAAVSHALSHPISMIQGGAGTGKTTIIEAIVSQFPGHTGYYLCAPTGKAARNLNERSNLSASTVYSTLGMTPDDNMLHTPPLEKVSMVIVDESSMLTLKEFAGILEAAKSASKIVLIGDPDQLQAVGSGNIMPDLQELGIPTFRLTTCHRQVGEERALLHNVRDFGSCHTVSDLLFDDSFSFKEVTTADALIQQLALEGSNRYRRRESVQVIAPTNSMVFALNQQMQAKLNPLKYDAGKPLELAIFDQKGRKLKLRDGDRVMMLRNNYTQHYCNGDVGTIQITNYDADEPKYTVVFPDGRKASWDCKSGLKDITQAYAITVHKSQGSEYDTILMPVTKIRMLNRNLLYTGISRAKKQVLLMGDMEALDAGLQTYPEPRKSGLVEKVLMETRFISKNRLNPSYKAS